MMKLSYGGKKDNLIKHQMSEQFMSCGCGCSGEVIAYEDWEEENVSAAEYQGRKVTLNKPFRTKGESKKFGVYTKNGSGKVVIVRFGDPNMEIKRDDPSRRKSFRSRHKCDTPGPKWKARYWSCRQWRGTKKVEAEAPCGCGCEEDVEAKDADDPCTSGYEQYGMKMKNGRKVPNCIPIKKKAEADYDVCASCMAQAKCAEEGECMEAKMKKPTMDKALKQAAEPKPKSSETHDEYMSRCQAAGYSEDECMKAHEGHTFKDQEEPHDEEDHDASYHNKKKKKYASECGIGEELIDGECKKIAVTIDLDIGEVSAIVEASTGETVIEIRGVAFHEGMNKNKWSLTPEGARNLIHQMKGADVTLNHPEANEKGAGFTRNTDGGVDEANVGKIITASYHATIGGGYEVRYVAHVTRNELFPSLESGLWSQDDYGVSIGGSGIPVSASEDGIVFGEDFTFDHLAIVYRPAYPRATIDSVKRIEKPEEIVASVISHSDRETVSEAEKVKAMTEETENTEIDYAAEIEALKADLVMANSRVNEFEAIESQRIEDERIALVSKASEMGMSGHDDLKADTLTTLIASWEASHPVEEPKVMDEVKSEPVVASETPTKSTSVVANYLNGKMVESDEELYSRCWNAWANAWNGTLSIDERSAMKAPKYNEIKEMN